MSRGHGVPTVVLNNSIYDRFQSESTVTAVLMSRHRPASLETAIPKNEPKYLGSYYYLMKLKLKRRKRRMGWL